MSSSITTFIATALVLFTLGQALADPARETAHPRMDTLVTNGR